MKIATWVLILVSFALAVASLVFGNPIGSLVQVMPPIVYFLKKKHPDNRVLCEITAPLSPVAREGMRSSEYSEKMVYYSSKWLAVFILVWSLVITFRINIDGSTFFLVIFAFAIPLFSGMAFLAAVFHTLKYLYIKVTGRESVWQESE